MSRLGASNLHEPCPDWGSWDETDEFLLYAARPRTSPPFQSPSINEWPIGTKIGNFWLEDDPWPIVIELFSIRTFDLPHNLSELLSATMLDVMKQGAILSWYMFDGVFNDVAQLFIPWQIERTYGICFPGETPQLALTKDARSVLAWRVLLEAAADYLYSRYPMLKTLYDGENEVET
jgi:hypothetical protein